MGEGDVPERRHKAKRRNWSGRAGIRGAMKESRKIAVWRELGEIEGGEGKGRTRDRAS